MGDSQFGGALLEGAQLQGALLEGTLAATDMRRAFLWRVHGNLKIRDSLVSELTWNPHFLNEDDDLITWTQDKYQTLRQAMMEGIPSGDNKTSALERIESVNCEEKKFVVPDKASFDLAPCDLRAGTRSDSSAELQSAFQKAGIDDIAYSKKLASGLGDIVCEGKGVAESVAAAAGMMAKMEKGKISSFAAAGLSTAWEDPDLGLIHILRGVLNNGRIEASGTEAPALVERILNTNCPVSAALTDDERAKLRALQKAAKH